MDLLGLRLQVKKEELPGEMIADLLVTAHRHEAEGPRKIAMNKIRGNREIFNDQGLRKGLEEAPNSFLIDAFEDL